MKSQQEKRKLLEKDEVLKSDLIEELVPMFIVGKLSFGVHEYCNEVAAFTAKIAQQIEDEGFGYRAKIVDDTQPEGKSRFAKVVK